MSNQTSDNTTVCNGTEHSIVSAWMDDLGIPAEAQVLIRKSLSIIELGSISTIQSTIWLSRWATVLAMGFTLGLCMYGILLAGASVGIKVALQKAGLHQVQPSATSKGKFRRAPSMTAARARSRAMTEAMEGAAEAKPKVIDRQ